MAGQFGDDGGELLASIAQTSPELEAVLRFTAGLTFAMRPSLFGLEMLLEQLSHKDGEESRRIVGLSILRAAELADGPHAAAVAKRLVPLLDMASEAIRLPVLHVLTSLRQPVALERCVQLAQEHAGNALGAVATVAASASRPEQLSALGAAFAGNPAQGWLMAAVAARLGDVGTIQYLKEAALDQALPWAARRRALLSLERLPARADLADLVGAILNERSLLGSLDAMNGEMSETVAGLLQDDPKLFAQLWRRGEAFFVEVLSETVRNQDRLGPRATAKQVDECLRSVWRQVQQHVLTGRNLAEALGSVMDSIQVLQVQAGALGAARHLGRSDLLERVIGEHDAPWLILQALVERTKMEPHAPEDATRWELLVAGGPFGADPSLRMAVAHIAGPYRAARGRPRPADEAAPALPVFSGGELLALSEEGRKPPTHFRVAELDEASLAALVARLDPSQDSETVEVLTEAVDGPRVTLTTAGATARSVGTRTIGRKGDRAGLRARLFARFPARVPASWLDRRYRGHAFVPAVINALGDEGDAVRALAVLTRLSDGDVTEVLVGRAHLGQLGRIADEGLVKWIGSLAGTGGASEVEALASFARHAAPDAVVPLLGRLMRRVAGWLADVDSRISSEPQDPWRLALVHLLRARRLRDVPGASAWLAGLLPKTTSGFMRREVIEAAEAFPAMWSVIETEALRGFEYGGAREPTFRKADCIAHSLFSKEHTT